MSKQEFLNALQGALTGRVNASQIAENVNYYDDYISAQVRMGRSEEEVTAELGSPRLLAKSIVEASRHADRSAGSAGNGVEDYGDSGYDGGYGSGMDYGGARQRKMPVWLIVLLVVLAVLAVLSMIFSAFVFLAPVLLPILFVVIVMKLVERGT